MAAATTAATAINDTSIAERPGEVARMAVRHPRSEDAPGACAREEGSERDERRDDRQAAAAGDPEAEKDDVAGHVRREDTAEPEIAGRVHQAGRECQNQKRPGKWVLDAMGGALTKWLVFSTPWGRRNGHRVLLSRMWHRLGC